MKNFFNRTQRLATAHRKSAKKTALLAIAAHHADVVRTLLEGLTEDAALSKEDKGELVAAAIDAKDLETYKAVCSSVGGPNVSIDAGVGFRKHLCLNACDQLHYALYTPGAEQIALFIASHPDYKTNDWMIAETRKLKLDEITSLLAQKLLPSHREALAQLEAEAAKAPQAAGPAPKKGGLNL